LFNLGFVVDDKNKQIYVPMVDRFRSVEESGLNAERGQDPSLPNCESGDSTEVASQRLRLRQRAYAGLMWRLEAWMGLNRIFIYQRDLTTLKLRLIPHDSTYAYRELSKSELLSAAQDPELKMTPEFVSSALIRGDRCFGATRDGILIAYHWYAFSGSAPCDGRVDISFDATRCAYQYKMFTRPRYRGRRLQLYSIMYSDTRLLEAGYTKIVLYVDSHNFASMRLLSRLDNLERVGHGWSMMIVGKPRSWCTAGAADLGFQLIPSLGTCKH